MANEKRTSCGLLVNWDDTPPADIPSASWTAIGVAQSVTPPAENLEEIDVSDVGVCRQEFTPGRDVPGEFTFTHYEDLASAETSALLAAKDAKTKAAWQIKYPYETQKYNKSFFGFIRNYEPASLDQTTPTLVNVTVRLTSPVTVDQDGP